MRTRPPWLAIVAAAVLLASPRAAASEPLRDARAAEALFAEGQASMERGDYRAACPKLAESYRLDPATGALFALALCHERLGLHASAWVEFMEVAARAHAERYPEREQAARERAEALHPKLSYLTVRVDPKTAGLPGLVVTRNGVRFGEAAWGTALPVDPGRHAIEASAPGHEPWRSAVVVQGEAQRVSIGIPELAARTPVERAGREPARDIGASEQGFEITPLRAVGIALGGAALAAFGVATYATVRALEKNADSEDDCGANNVCGVAGDRDRTSAREAAAFATVGVVTGGILLGSGALLFVLGAPEADGAEGGAALAPSGVILGFRGTY